MFFMIRLQILLHKKCSILTALCFNRFGRRPTYIFLTLLVFVTLLLQSFANSTWMFAIAFIFSGISSASNFLVGFVICKLEIYFQMFELLTFFYKNHVFKKIQYNNFHQCYIEVKSMSNILAGEYTTPENRNFFSIAWFLGFSSGYLLTSFIGYLTPDWRWLVRVSSAFGLLYLSNIW